VTRMTAQLAVAALGSAIARRQPVGTVVVHSDRGGLGAVLGAVRPVLDFPAELRKLGPLGGTDCSAPLSNSSCTRRRGHFPHEHAALKVLYLCVKRRDKNRSNPTGRGPAITKSLTVPTRAPARPFPVNRTRASVHRALHLPSAGRARSRPGAVIWLDAMAFRYFGLGLDRGSRHSLDYHSPSMSCRLLSQRPATMYGRC